MFIKQIYKIEPRQLDSGNVPHSPFSFDRVERKGALVLRGNFVLSNSELYIDYFAEISSNIGSFWSSAPNEIKVDFQELVFTDGVVYDQTKEIYRTPRVNSLFLMTAGLTE